MGKISLSNLAEELATKRGISREAATQFLHAFIDTIEKGLLHDNIVKVKGLGTFKVQEMSDRDSIDVNTGERITIKGYRKVSFVPDSAMRELVNRPFAHFEPTELNDGYPTEEEPIGEASINTDDTETVGEYVAETIAEAAAEVIKAPVEEPTEEVKTDASVEADTEPATATELPVTVADESTLQSAISESEKSTSEDAAASVNEDNPECPPHEVIAEEESAAIEPTEDTTPDSPDFQIAAEEQSTPNKRRGSGCLWGVLFIAVILLVLAQNYGWITFGPDSLEPMHEESIDQVEDIVVNPNLEEELGIAWEESAKNDKSASSVNQVTKPTKEVKQSAPVAHDTTKTNAAESQPAVTQSLPTPAATTPQPGGDASHGALPLTASLKAKAIKDITLADTTDYVIDGTLATHNLKRGETIVQLANKYYGDKRLWPYLVKHNNLSDYNNVAIGQEIDIPVLKQK